jgi:phosphate-selective porin OprO/OprP
MPETRLFARSTLVVVGRWLVSRSLGALFFVLGGIETSAAQSLLAVDVVATPTPQARPFSLGDTLENMGRVYKDDKGEVFQELWLLGRYHGQYHWTEASTGEDDGYETRRMRMGAQARLLKKMTLHAQMVSGSDVSPFYNGFTELWAQWAFAPEFAITIGQQKHRFTHDRNVSSRYLNYLERAMLTNMFALDYTPAVTAQGKVKDLTYYTGIFSNATGRDMEEAFTDLDSGYSYIAAAYYELGKAIGVDSATIHLTFVHSNANDNATTLNRFDDGVSSALILTKGQASLVTELLGGFGSDNGNAIGLNLQPSYFFNRKWQIVSRYQLAGSNDEQGLSPQKRYEQKAGMPAGDSYQALYLGLNYYIAKHRLKLMNGIEYANMNGDDAWTASTMVRFYFGPHSGGAFPMNQILPLDYD